MIIPKRQKYILFCDYSQEKLTRYNVKKTTQMRQMFPTASIIIILRRILRERQRGVIGKTKSKKRRIAKANGSEK